MASGDRADERARRAVLGGRPPAVLRPRGARARRARAGRLAEERAHGRGRLPRARPRARARSRVHGRELHELRLVPPGLRHECRQVDDEHVHPRRAGAGRARAARRLNRGASADRRLGGDRRRVRRRSGGAADSAARGRWSWPPARSTRRSCWCAAASTTPPSGGTSGCTRCAWSTGSSTSRRTRTWSTR